MDLGKLFKDAWGLFVKDIGQLLVGMLIANLVPGAAASAIVFVGLFAALPGLSIDSASGELSGLGAATIVALVAGVVAAFVAIIVLAIPLYAGVLHGVLRRVREQREMSYTDDFSGFHDFARIMGAYLLPYVVVPLLLLAVPLAVAILAAVFEALALAIVAALLAVAAAVLLVYLGVCWTYVLLLVLDRGVGVREAMRESRALVGGIGWWWTFLALFLLQLAIGAVSAASGMVPVVGVLITVPLMAFAATFLVAMYFRSRHEDGLIDKALWTPPVASPQTPYVAPSYWPPAPPAQPTWQAVSQANGVTPEGGENVADAGGVSDATSAPPLPPLPPEPPQPVL